MLPVTHGIAYTRLQVLLYASMLFAVTLLPFVIGMSGWLYLSAAVVLGARFVWYAWALWRRRDDRLAMPMFVYSITYLFGLFSALLGDRFLRLLVA